MSDFTLHAGKARVLSFPLSNKNLCAVRSRMRFRSGSTAARFLLGLAAAVSLVWVSRSLCQQKGLLSSGRRPGGYTLSHEYLPTMHSSARKAAIMDLSAERVFREADQDEETSATYFFSSIFQDKLR